MTSQREESLLASLIVDSITCVFACMFVSLLSCLQICLQACFQQGMGSSPLQRRGEAGATLGPQEQRAGARREVRAQQRSDPVTSGARKNRVGKLEKLPSPLILLWSAILLWFNPLDDTRIRQAFQACVHCVVNPRFPDYNSKNKERCNYNGNQ